MSANSLPSEIPFSNKRASRHLRGWFFLVGALAVHVIDEAMPGFLGFYSPLVRSIRSRVPWFPMPTFTFGIWLAGLTAGVLLLVLLAQAVHRNASGTRLASWLLSGIMFLNGLGHLGGSLFFRRWLPGTTSAPLLLFGSILLARRTWERSRWASAGLDEVPDRQRLSHW